MLHRPSPILFQKTTSLWVKVILAICASIIMLLLDTRFVMLEKVRLAIGYGLSPMQQTLAYVPKTIHQVGSYGKNQFDLVAENQNLHQRLTQELIKANQFKALAEENQHLKNLLNIQTQGQIKTTVAEVFYTQRHPFSQTVLINKGSDDGIAAGQIVINETGLLGQIIRSYKNQSEVNLITQKEQSVPVELQKSSEYGIAVGDGSPNTLDLKFIGQNSNLQKGDLVMTSGLDQTYPAGIPVAIVENIERNTNDGFLKITCKPIATALGERYVMIVENKLNPSIIQNTQNTTNIQTTNNHHLRAK